MSNFKCKVELYIIKNCIIAKNYQLSISKCNITLVLRKNKSLSTEDINLKYLLLHILAEIHSFAENHLF